MFKVLLLICCTMVNIVANEVFQKLDRAMIDANSFVCVGLDPDITKIPLSIVKTASNTEDNVYNFLTQIIDITAPYACSFKLQKAFYDQFDLGHDLLRKTVAYIHENHPGIPAFIDCKIGDTDNTMKAYMYLLFEDIKADAVVINPYMGDDVLEPFIQDKNKVGILLIQTSNPNAKIVQELALSNGKKLWEQMLDFAVGRWNKNKNLILVLSSNTDTQDYAAIREKIPQDMPILLAGIGAQGGNPAILKQLLNKNGRGVFVNSSRGILYPYNRSDEQWKDAVLKAVIELKEALNTIRMGA